MGGYLEGRMTKTPVKVIEVIEWIKLWRMVHALELLDIPGLLESKRAYYRYRPDHYEAYKQSLIGKNSKT